MSPTLDSIVRDVEVIITAGSGGVGKTTSSAALAVAAARAGRRVVVVTIDPAKRLADALGLGSGGLGDAPSVIDGAWPGELWAAMLDTRATFDALIRREASPDQAEQIITNRFYLNIADSLSGTQEYMAAEKLHELHGDTRFDLVIVDTPPSRNALDFIEAPNTLTRFLDHRLYRLLVTPTRRVVGAAASAFVRTISSIAGGAVVKDAVDFFRAFDGLEDGFRQRAKEVSALLRDERTAVVLVTSPRREAIDEAAWFARALRDSGLGVDGVVVNRMQPRPVDGPTGRYADLAREHADTDLATLCTVLVDQCETADRETAMVEALLHEVGDVAPTLVPELRRDVRDLSGLEEVADHLVVD
jgi:anion-transporting  ArsA/GET3 family ATPase